jgi:heme/copper-type cytochrome/quinol oxidase subunit 4
MQFLAPGVDRVTRVTTLLAAVLWLAAWFLPVMDEANGWQAFRTATSSIWPYHGNDHSGDDAIPQILSAATNVVFVILVANAWRAQVTRPGLFIRIAIACVVLNLYWFVQLARGHELGDLRIGYYLWVAAFALLVVSGVSIHRTSRIPTAGR